MEPFISNAFKNGKYILEFQCEGIQSVQIKDVLKHAEIIAYAMPETHSFQSAWLFQIFLNNGYRVEFSSSSTDIGNWQEIGSLNLHFSQELYSRQKNEERLFVRTEIRSFHIASIDKLTYVDPNVYAECGIVFYDLSGQELIITASSAPGSVSILAPFSIEKFQPEFSVEDYQRKLIC